MSLDEIRELINSRPSKGKKFDAAKFCGIMKFEEDAVEYRRRLRSEWN